MVRFVFGIVFGILAIIFAALNTQIVEVQLYFWTVTMSRALMILGVLAIGMVVGWVMGGIGRMRRSRNRS